MKKNILDGANMDIDLVSEGGTSWKQMKCPWNEKFHLLGAIALEHSEGVTFSAVSQK